MVHGIKSLAAARKIVLSRMKNHSQPNDFSFGAEKNSVMTKAMVTSLRSTAERWSDERSSSNQLIINLLYQNLKDEWQFRKTLGGREAA